MNNRYISIIILLAVSFILYFYDNIISDFILVVVLVAGLDLSSDLVFDQMVESPGSDYNYSFLLLGFITSLDEILVAAGSVFSGFPQIGSGALLGSSVLIIILYSMIVAISRSTFHFMHPYYFLIFPFILVLELISYNYSLNATPVYALSIIVSLVVVWKVIRGWQIIPGKSEGRRMTGFIFLIPLVIFALLLSIGTERISSAVKISQFMSGFLIPGVLGTIPEMIMIYGTFRRNIHNAGEGLLTGSTIMKGTLLFPVVQVLCYADTRADTPLIIFSAVVSVFFACVLFFKEFRP